MRKMWYVEREEHDAATMARPDFRKRGYHSGWDPIARDFKARYPLCLGCWACGLETPTEVVDHVVPFARNKTRLLDPANLQPSCKWHHDNIKRTLELQWRLGYLPESALWLNSVHAKALTRQRYLVPINVHGYREWEWNDLEIRPYPGGWP